MRDEILRLKSLLESINFFFNTATIEENSTIPQEDKWSKKEILGHLIDSGVNNLQRFTEVKFSEQPYKLRTYKQRELVDANDYQNANMNELSSFFIALNTRILKIIEGCSSEVLEYKILINDPAEEVTLRFLITDYVDHMEHHTKQILKK